MFCPLVIEFYVKRKNIQKHYWTMKEKPKVWSNTELDRRRGWCTVEVKEEVHDSFWRGSLLA
jgi:hypothetical protein